MNRMLKNSLWGIVLGMLGVVFSVATTEATDPPHWGAQINKPSRFEVLKDFNFEAVLDHETQLVWERSPGDTDFDMDVDDDDKETWSLAGLHCLRKNVGGRKGWRLPAIYELMTLMEPLVPFIAPTLPAGHPFNNVQPSGYFSATTVAEDTDRAWFASFAAHNVDNNIKTFPCCFVWCVRGGSPGPDQY